MSLKVAQLLIHPIKSCRGISVQQADYDRHGFLLDRRWLVIYTNSLKFATCRETAKLILVETAIKGDELIVTIPNDPPEEYSLSLWPDQDELEDAELIDNVNIWGADVDAYACSSEIDQALTQFLGKSVRLVRKGPKHRNTGEDPTCGALEYDEGAKGVNFQDQYPMQVVSGASLEGARQLVRDVVSQGGQQIEHLDPAKWPEQRIQDLTIERWRPNIVVSGPLKPFEEDGWESIEVGPDRKVIYTVVRCARCMVPNLKPETAERDEAVPWSVMQLSRVKHPEVFAKYCFGMQSVPAADSGCIRVGDEVRVTKQCDPATRKMIPPF